MLQKCIKKTNKKYFINSAPPDSPTSSHIYTDAQMHRERGEREKEREWRGEKWRENGKRGWEGRKRLEFNTKYNKTKMNLSNKEKDRNKHIKMFIQTKTYKNIFDKEIKKEISLRREFTEFGSNKL